MTKHIARQILVALVLLVGCRTARPTAPVGPSPATVAMWEDTCRAVVREGRDRPITEAELAACVAYARAGAQVADLRLWVTTLPPEPVPSLTLPPLVSDGRIFRANGAPWRWIGVSAFQLLDRFAKGEDLGPFLAAYQGYRVLRVWPYVPGKGWGAQAWDAPPAATILAFLADMEARGWYVELTLLTDDDPARLPWARALVQTLTAARPPNLLIEIGNEPDTHKAIQTSALVEVLAASGLPWTSGNYEDAAKMRGTYGVAHTARDSEWPRRAHDLLDYFTGGGPNAPTDPPHSFPMIADEPAKLQDVTGDHARDWRAYFAACALLGGGATFHSETGKYAQPPTAEEAALAREALEALEAFPADAPLGAYRRIDEHGATLRTYVVGTYMVRIRPTTPTAPEPGWTALDADGILWRR